MRGRLFALTLAAACGIVAADALRADSDAVIRLPTFTVTDSRLLPKPESWKYASVPGFEVLSTAGVTATKAAIQDFLTFHRALQSVWPLERANAAIPASLIFCGHASQLAAFLPANVAPYARGTLSVSYQDKEMASIVVQFDAAALDVDGAPAGQSDEYTQRILHQEYIHFLLDRLGSRTPPWLREGLWQLFTRMVYRGNEFAIAAVTDDPTLASRTTGGAAALAAAVQNGDLLPLSRLFTSPAQGDDSASEMNPWQRESYEFVHFCLFGTQPDRKRAFLEFALRASRAPYSGGLLQSCFGCSPAQLEAAFWQYTGFSKVLSFKILGPNGGPPAPLPTVTLREATDAEVGRIRGETLRMAGKVQESHLALIAPYLRGSRDPQLLASLGLQEAAAGRDERAGKFLEAAVAGHTTRARAYAELGRLRLNAALAHPAGPGGTLSVAQMVQVFQPLFAGRSFPPPLPETYELIAQAWSRSSFRPTLGHLAAIDEGVRLFPFDTQIVCADAELHAKDGYGPAAAKLCAVGLEYADSAAARAQLAAVQAALH